MGQQGNFQYYLEIPFQAFGFQKLYSSCNIQHRMAAAELHWNASRFLQRTLALLFPLPGAMAQISIVVGSKDQ